MANSEKRFTLGLAKSQVDHINRRAKKHGLTAQNYVRKLIESDRDTAADADMPTFAQIVPAEPIADETEIDRLVKKITNRFYRRSKKRR